jgi:hypothetical protein
LFDAGPGSARASTAETSSCPRSRRLAARPRSANESRGQRSCGRRAGGSRRVPAPSCSRARRGAARPAQRARALNDGVRFAIFIRRFSSLYSATRARV